MKARLLFIGLAVALLATAMGAHGAAISGKVFFDLNANGQHDAVSEYGLPQWTVRLDVVPTAAGWPHSVMTDVNGNFSFGSLPAGSYQVSAVNPSPWLQTYPSGSAMHVLTLSASDVVSGQDFGCHQPARVPQIQWQKSLGGSKSDSVGLFGRKVVQTSDGGYLIGGGSSSGPSGLKTSLNYGGSDFWIVRLDALGNYLWDRSYGGPGDEWISSVCQTPDGGFILAGRTDGGAGGTKTSANFGRSDCWVVRVDAAGNKLWEREFGGTGDDMFWGCGLALTSDGGCIIAGYSESGATGNKTALPFGAGDGWVIRLNSNGDKVWDRVYGGTDFEDFVGLVPAGNGDFFLVAETGSEPASGLNGNKTSPKVAAWWDYWLVKINADGDPLWDKSFGSAVHNYIAGLAATADGGAVITGVSWGGPGGNRTAPQRTLPSGWDAWVVRVDANGSKLWDQSYGGDEGGDGLVPAVLTDGRIVLAGDSSAGLSGNKVSPSFGNVDRWVMLTDANGDPIWDQAFGAAGDDGFFVATPTQDGGVVLLGGTTANGGNIATPQYGQGDILIAKLGPLACPASAPTLLAAAADCAQHQITLTFSAALDSATALQPANYSLSGGLTVQAVSFGTSTFSVILDTPSLVSGVTYTLTINGLLDDCGNALAANTQTTAICPGEIRGKVFSDWQNHNCKQDGSELTVPNWPVRLDPGGTTMFTDASGNYRFAVPVGNYTVSVMDDGSGKWKRTCPAGLAYSVALADGQIVTDKDFALEPLGARCPDLWVNLSASYPGPKTEHGLGSSPCCGTDFTYRLDFGNQGNGDSLSASTITLTLPANCSFVSANPPASGPWVASGTLLCPGCPVTVQFNPNVPAHGFWSVDIQVHLECNGGLLCDQQLPLKAEAVFARIFDDCPPNPGWLNNRSKHQVTPCCSSDPNDCTVSPKGCGPEGFVHRDQMLTYLVQFQNLGGGPAHLVVVKNVLDEDLDLSTLEIIGSSHPNLLERNGRELTWTFPNIELAPVLLNESASHGYVKFRARPRADAPAGTVIINSAEIVFDINAPMTTIVTTSTITEDPVPLADFQVIPQPGSAGVINTFLYTGGTVGAEYHWDFGPDATPPTSNEQNPTGVVFANPGLHLVSLTTRLGDCESEPAIHSVTVGAPRLTVTQTPNGPGLSWDGDGYRLQEKGSLKPPVSWSPVVATPFALDGWYFVQLPEPDSARFYRLEQWP